MEYDPQEIEGLIGMKKTRKRKRMNPPDNPISAKKDKSHITCIECETARHYASDCPEKKQRTQGGTRKPIDLSDVIRLHYKEAGHFARECSGPRIA